MTDQLERVLRNVVSDVLDEKLKPLQDGLSDLTGSVGELSKKLNDFMAQEWPTHRSEEHSRIEKRLSAIEQHLGIRPAA